MPKPQQSANGVTLQVLIGRRYRLWCMQIVRGYKCFTKAACFIMFQFAQT